MGNMRFMAVTGYANSRVESVMPVDFAQRWIEEMAKQAAATPIGATEASDLFLPVDLETIFESGQPDCFYEGEGDLPYRGQANVKERLRENIRALEPNQRMKALFTGPAGLGKTTIARLVAKEIKLQHYWQGLPMGGYFETLPTQINDKAKRDAFFKMLVADPYATWFIDEVHTLKDIEDLFHVLHDTGPGSYPMADGSKLVIPPTISFLAATTDPGEADNTTGGALLRRLAPPEYRLEPNSTEELAEIVFDAAGYDEYEVDADSAMQIAVRSTFPWEVKSLYEMARNVAKNRGSKRIDPEHTLKAADLLEIDEHGLRREHRDVIGALLRVNGGRGITIATGPDKGSVRFRMAEGSLCAAAYIDRKTFEKRVKPVLMARGLLVPIQGQCLTEEAVEMYSHLR